MISFFKSLLQSKEFYPENSFSVFLAASVFIHAALFFSFSLYGSNNSLARHEIFDIDLVAPKKQQVIENREDVAPAPEIKTPVQTRIEKPRSKTALKKSVSKDIPVVTPVPATEKEATVSLDSAGGKKPSIYDPYLQHLRARINAVWKYPSEAKQRQLGGSLTLRFSISHNGSLIGVQMLRSSGNDILDREALRTIHDAAPFMQLPRSLAIERLNVLASFDYQFSP